MTCCNQYNKVSETSNSSKKAGKTNVSTSDNGTFSLSDSFEALNVDNTFAEELNLGKKLIIILENLRLSLSDDEGKPLTKIDYTGNHDSKDTIEPVDNKMASFLASKPLGVSTNSLLEQWRETYGNADYDYDPYDDDMHED
ncbi:hypothetical protein Tco_0496394 [Tanacetum coccineum]